MRARLPGTRRAPPTPWTPRATTSDAAPPQAVAEGAAHEDERRQEERVRLHDPLHLRRRPAERPLDRGQRDVDDRAVEEDEGRPEDGDDERPARRRDAP